MPQICVRLSDEQKRHLDEQAAGASVAAVVRRLIDESRGRTHAKQIRLLPKSVDLDIADALSMSQEGSR